MLSYLTSWFWGSASEPPPSEEVLEISEVDWLDLFYLEEIGEDLFSRCYADNKSMTMKTMFYIRSQSGLGNRRVWLDFVRWLSTADPDVFMNRIWLEKAFIEVGRFDDIFAACVNDYDKSLPAEKYVYDFVSSLLVNEELPAEIRARCAKWVPSEGSQLRAVNFKLANHMGITQECLRKSFLTPLRRIIPMPERELSGMRWSNIDYNMVSASAMAKYSKAFARHDPVGYSKWLIGKKAITLDHPMQAIGFYWKSTHMHYLVEKRWEEFGKTRNTLCFLAACNTDKHPSISKLACSFTLLSSNSGPFASTVSCGSGKLRPIQGKTIKDKLTFVKNNQIKPGDAYSLDRSLRNMLAYAVATICTAEDMPSRVIIFSDNLESLCLQDVLPGVKKEFESAGYRMPLLIVWTNLTGQISISEIGDVSIVQGYSKLLYQHMISCVDISRKSFAEGVLKNINV